MALGPMALATFLMLCIGIERGARKIGRDTMSLMGIIGLLAAIMMLQRGFYWNLFPAGQGPVTANRVSALAVWAACFFIHDVLQAADRWKARRR